jgi:hypothetical protein
MTDRAKKISELQATTSVANTDKLVVLKDAANSSIASTRSITVSAFVNSVATKITSDIIPSTNNTYSLGNTTHQWKSSYIANTIYLGGYPLTISNGSLRVNNSVISETVFLTPNIAYTGVFNGYPATLGLTKGLSILVTANSFVLETPNKYWLSTRFDTDDYDLSGTQTITFNNIGGIDANFRLGGKSETLLTTVNLGDIVAIDSNFYLRDLPALTTFNANNLVYVRGNFQIDTMDNANTQFNFPNLKTIVGIFYYTYNDTLENTPQFPELETVSDFYIYYNTATQNTMVFDSLRYFDYGTIYQNSGMLAGPEFPALTSMGYFDVNNNNNMIDPPTFPVLETMTSSFYFYNNSSVTTAPATPSLVSCTFIEWYDNASMVNGFDFSSLQNVDGNVNISGCALDQESVDYILTTLAGLDGVNGAIYENRTVNLSGGTNAVPSATGLAAIATLEGRGCTLYYNTP